MTTNAPLQRTGGEIHRDMLEAARTEIYARTRKEWDYAGQDFDPLVHLLTGALASEIKTVYEAIGDSDRRVLRHLADMLLPESLHLPAPAHSLAAAQPNGASYLLSESLQLKCELADRPVHFSPVFENTLLAAQLRFVASEAGVFEYHDAPDRRRPSGQSVMTQRLLLGFDCPKPPESLGGALFYFDLAGIDNRKSVFLEAISQGKWILQDQETAKTPGFGAAAAPEDSLETTRSLKRRIEAIYGPNFVSLLDTDRKLQIEKSSAGAYLLQWLTLNNLLRPDNETQARAFEAVSGNFMWLEIRFPYPVRVHDLSAHLRCGTNIFPVVNRFLEVKDDADTFFDRPTLQVIHLASERPFAGVRRVFRQQDGAPFGYLPLVKFQEQEGPVFSLRYAGVGRLDNYNVWERFTYLFGVLREEHRLREVVDKIGHNISLEDLHQMLGEQIDKEEYKKAIAKPHHLYVFLHPGLRARGVRAIVEYWTTMGAFANNLPVGQPLVAVRADAGLKKEDKSEVVARLIHPSGGGKDAASEPELYQALKDAIVRRDRLTTREDVKNFCRTRLGDNLIDVALQTGMELDPRPGFGITRTNEVWLTVKEPENPAWEDTCREIESSITRLSMSALPYRLKIKPA